MGSTSTEDRRSSARSTLSTREMYDLSKSPVPMKRSYMFDFAKSPFHRQGSSVLTNASDYSRQHYAPAGVGAQDTHLDDGNMPSMRHSASSGTFHHDADILWEKRVALDCVGAVRSSEQEYGYHVFELLAYGTADGDDDDDGSRGGGGGSIPGGRGGNVQNQQQIVDRLILRAGSSDDMNDWMFQFYRSLSTFAERVVNSVRSKDDSAVRAGRHNLGGGRPDSPMHQRPTGGGVANKGQSSFASSPITVGESSSFGGGGGGFVGSLSHGHGRNALYRRQVRDGVNKKRSSSCDASSVVVSPLHTPAGTPVGGSPILMDSRKKEPSNMIQYDPSRMKDRVELPSLKDLRGRGREGEASDGACSRVIPAAVPAAEDQQVSSIDGQQTAMWVVICYIRMGESSFSQSLQMIVMWIYPGYGMRFLA